MPRLANMLTSLNSNYREPITTTLTRKSFTNIFHHTVPTEPIYSLQEKNPHAVALLHLLLPPHLQPPSLLGNHHSQLSCWPPLVSCHLLPTNLELSEITDQRPKSNHRFPSPHHSPLARRFLQLLPPSSTRQHDLEVWAFISDHVSVTLELLNENLCSKGRFK